MPPARRRGRRPAEFGDTETSIRLAALQRFACNGYDATSLRNIAADAGVDVALVSYKFGSKLGLWKSIVERVGAAKVERLKAVSQTETTDAAKALATAMSTLIDIDCDNVAVPRFLLRDAGHDPKRSQWVFEHILRPVLDHFVPLIRRAHDMGRLTAPVPELFLLTFAYGVAAGAIRRDMIVGFAPDLAQDEGFRAALRATLIEPHFRHG